MNANLWLIFVALFLLLIFPTKGISSTCSNSLKAPLDVWHSGWSHDLERTRFPSVQEAGLDAKDLPELELAWAYVFKGSRRPRSLPAVTKQAVFVGNEDGTVTALNRASGCTYWQFTADAEVRTAITATNYQADGKQAVARLFFMDLSTNVYSLDALSGELLWKVRAGDHASARGTGSPVLYEDQLIVPIASGEVLAALNPFYECCTSRGSIASLNPLDGSLKWRTYTVDEEPRLTERNILFADQYGPSGAGVWSAPTIDTKSRRIYIGTGQNYSSPADGNSDAIIALDLDSGRKIWVRQLLANDAWNVACNTFLLSANCPEEDGVDADFGAPPILVTRSNSQQVIVAGQKNGYVHALDPDGNLHWSRRFGRGGLMGGIHWGMVATEDSIYVPMSDVNTPFVTNTRPGLRKPGLTKVDLLTGDVVWFSSEFTECAMDNSCANGYSAALTGIPGAILAPGLDGILRAHSVDDGSVVWRFDSTQSVMGSNKIMGHGGGLDAVGVVATHGMLIFPSGYGGPLPTDLDSGNVLWVLKIPDR